MNLVRWDPFRELEEMTERLNRFVSRTEPAEGWRDNMVVADWAPRCDIEETAEEYLVKAELPDVAKDDIQVSIDHGVLAIHGERKAEKEEKGKRFRRIERSFGTFHRSFTLPEDVDEAKLNATYRDGVLEVHLPKAPREKPRTITVH